MLKQEARSEKSSSSRAQSKPHTNAHLTRRSLLADAADAAALPDSFFFPNRLSACTTVSSSKSRGIRASRICGSAIVAAAAAQQRGLHGQQTLNESKQRRQTFRGIHRYQPQRARWTKTHPSTSTAPEAHHTTRQLHAACSHRAQQTRQDYPGTRMHGDGKNITASPPRLLGAVGTSGASSDNCAAEAAQRRDRQTKEETRQHKEETARPS